MKTPGLPKTLLVLAVLAAPLLAAPPVIRGLAAFEWVNYYGSLEELPRPHRGAARALVQKTALAVHNLAPLPQASEAALRALEIAQRVQGLEGDPEAALVIYRGVREACASVRGRPLSGAGFAVIEARAAALEQAAQQGTSGR